MSFYHVLPSNVSSQMFPNNHASSFSTPIENPYIFNEDWEMALMNLTYAGCVKTFNNDTFELEKNLTTADLLYIKKPIKITLPKGKSISDIIKILSEEKLKGILKFTFSKQGRCIRWNLLTNKFCLVFQSEFRDFLNMWNGVITSWDTFPENWNTLDVKTETPQEFYLLLVPLNYNSEIISFKKANEKMDAETFVELFNSKMKGIALAKFNRKIKGSHIILHKLHENDKKVIVLSSQLREVLRYRQSGIIDKESIRYLSFDFTRCFKEKLSLQIITIEEIDNFGSKMSRMITLKPHTFQQQKEAMPFINESVNDQSVSFSCDKNNHVQLTINQEDVRVKFSNTLRDIFAFDENEYKGKGTYSASDEFSLSRRIQFLYIYSNISNYVRIGNTEAPLLAVIPFAKGNCDLLMEKTFKVPMYVGVKDRYISRIDIEIYDDAGELVPFTSTAITSLRLHFRQS